MRNLVLSADKLSDITICPRRYWFKHELRKIPASKPKYLSEGELFHSILEYYYNDIMKERKQNNGFYIEIARNKAAEFSDLNIEESELLVKILIDYLNYYANESWKILGVEAPFAKVFIEDEKMDLRVIIRGKSDLVVDASGNKAIVDHKVVSQNRAIFGRNNQNLAYLWALDSRDFIINSIGKQKTLPSEKKFRREYFSYGEHQIEEWKESTMNSIFNLMRYNEMNYFPAHFTGCSLHGLRCAYYEVCESTPDNWEYKLASFVEKPELDIMEIEDNEA